MGVPLTKRHKKSAIFRRDAHVGCDPQSPILPYKNFNAGVNAAIAAFENGEKVMVFCKSGRHRSVTTACCILVGRGYGAEEAINLVESKRPQADLNDALRKRIKSFEQAWLEQSGRHRSE